MMIAPRGLSDGGLSQLEKSPNLEICVGECSKATHTSGSGLALGREVSSEYKWTRRSTLDCAAASVERDRPGKKNAVEYWDCQWRYHPATCDLQTRETSELEIESAARHLISFVLWKEIVR